MSELKITCGKLMYVTQNESFIDEIQEEKDRLLQDVRNRDKRITELEAQLDAVREIVKGTNPDGLTHYQTQQIQAALNGEDDG